MRKLTLMLAVCVLATWFASADEAHLSAATEPTAAVAADAEAFFAELEGRGATAKAACPAPTCNRNLDCFGQIYSCPGGTAKHCFGGPTTGCQGECGCF